MKPEGLRGSSSLLLPIKTAIPSPSESHSTGSRKAGRGGPQAATQLTACDSLLICNQHLDGNMAFPELFTPEATTGNVWCDLTISSLPDRLSVTIIDSGQMGLGGFIHFTSSLCICNGHGCRKEGTWKRHQLRFCPL